MGRSEDRKIRRWEDKKMRRYDYLIAILNSMTKTSLDNPILSEVLFRYGWFEMSYSHYRRKPGLREANIMTR
jgi:hypothetical protein